MANPAKSSPHNKAKMVAGSPRKPSKGQGFDGAGYNGSNKKVMPGAAKSNIGSGSKAIKPETSAALRNAGC